MPFSINHSPSTIFPELRAALRTLKLPIRQPAKGLNQIGERLTALLHPNGRGQLDEDLIRRYLQAVAIRMAGLGKPWKQITDAELLAEVGVRKVIIAAGKSTRFSSGLARKQLALGDGYSTLLLHARQAVGFHCCPDVIAVDAVVAWKCLKPHTITKATFEKALDVIDVPKRIKKKVSRALLEERGDRLPACQPPEEDPEASLQGIKETFSESFSLSAQATEIFDDFLHALMQPIVEASDVPLKGCPETGEDVLLALAKPWGPGEALIAGMARLKKLGLAGQTKYVMPIYSDYAPALLPRYAAIYLQSYMEAVIEDATITIGAKSPLDKVKDRGNIIFRGEEKERGERREERGGRLEPIAIREWRDMTKKEQAECERRLQQSRESALPPSSPLSPSSPLFHHGLNAGVFVIDLAWAARQAARQHKEFDHPDPVKGKEHEYWYTDLVEIAARQRKPRHVVFLGPDAPSGCKDAERMHQYHADILEATKQTLLALGVRLDPSAEVRLRSRSPSFSIEDAAKKIFGERDESLAAERQDHVCIFGDVFIEDEVTIGRGVVLDGRSKPVYLEGATYVSDGANITGSRVHTALVVPDEDLKGAESLLHTCGAALIGELAPEDQEGILRFIRSETDKFLSRLKSKKRRERARQTTGQLWQKSEFLKQQTAESLYRHAFAWLRSSGSTDPFAAEKRSELSALRPLANEHWGRLAKHDFNLYGFSPGGAEACSLGRKPQDSEDSGSPVPEGRKQTPPEGRLQRSVNSPSPARKLFKELTLLATRANLFDWQSPTVRDLISDIGNPEKAQQRSKSREAPSTPSLQHSNTPSEETTPASRIQHLASRLPAIDHYDEYEAMVFGTPSTFLYLTDNTGETLFDALVWFMLCELGHTVVVAAKDKPAGGDATVRDVMSIIRKRKTLKQHLDRRNLRVISNGNDTYGTFLDRLPEEFLAVYRDPSLRAIIGKGQANFYTTVARNRLDAPFVAQFLIKGMTAEKVTGIRLRRNKEGKKVPRPVIAVIPPGECVTQVAPGMPGARTLKEMTEWGGCRYWE